MFQQNPHLLYKALLTHNYSLQKAESSDWYHLICNEHKLNVRFHNGTLYILDPDHDINFYFPWVDLFGSKYINQNIVKIIDEYVDIIKKSLKSDNIEIMNLIIYEITQKYPDIEEITFLNAPTETKQSSIFVDQKNRFYDTKGFNIPEFLTCFCFIDNIELSFTHFLKKTSNHVMLENTEKYLKYKKKFKTDTYIKKMQFKG